MKRIFSFAHPKKIISGYAGVRFPRHTQSRRYSRRAGTWAEAIFILWVAFLLFLFTRQQYDLYLEDATALYANEKAIQFAKQIPRNAARIPAAIENLVQTKQALAVQLASSAAWPRFPAAIPNNIAPDLPRFSPPYSTFETPEQRLPNPQAPGEYVRAIGVTIPIGGRADIFARFWVDMFPIYRQHALTYLLLPILAAFFGGGAAILFLNTYHPTAPRAANTRTGEKSIHQEPLLFQHTLSTLPIAAIYVDESYRCTYWNEMACAYFPHLAHNAQAFVHMHDLHPPLKKHIQLGFEKACYGEPHHLTLDGTDLPVQHDLHNRTLYLHFTPHLPADGLDTGILIYITENNVSAAQYIALKNQHAHLQESHQTQGLLFKEILHGLADGFTLWDDKDTLVLHTDAMHHLVPEMAEHLKPGISFSELLRICLHNEIPLSFLRDPKAVTLRETVHNIGGSMDMETADGRHIRITERKTSNNWVMTLYTDITSTSVISRMLTHRAIDTRSLLDILTDLNLDQSLRIQKLLKYVLDRFGMANAYISIPQNDGHLHVYNLQSPDFINLLSRAATKPKALHAITKNMFASLPLETGSPLYIHNAVQEGYSHHEGYSLYGIQSYVGVPLSCDMLPDLSHDQISAFLKSGNTPPNTTAIMALTAKKPRKPFSNTEKDLVNILRWCIERELNDAARQHRLGIAQEEAELSNKIKSTFLANMSHELRTPLNAIIGFSEIMQDELFGPLGKPIYREYSENIFASGRHLLELINDILDVSKIESGKEELQNNMIDFKVLGNQVVRLLNQKAQSKRIHLLFFYQEDLPLLLADERRLRQVLMNLIGNALKFTPAQGTVRLESYLCHDHLHVRIKDTGIGIAPQDISVALTPFGQIGDPSQNCLEGTGLGLPLSKKIIELHDGTFRIASTVGQGTEITLVLPPYRLRHKNTPQTPPSKQPQTIGTPEAMH